MPAAAAGKLVAFGIVARTPETGYGYIRRARRRARAVAPIAQFVEKPDLARAREFIASGDYFWNSGMFMFGAARFLDELAAHAPDIAEVCARASATAVREKDFTRVDEAVFAACRSDSVDYAVMEKTRDAVMVPLDAGWNDVGSWAALHDVLPADERGNVVRGDVLLEDADGCYVHADSRLVAALGLHDMVIVETADAVLVAPKAKVQDVKKLVARIKAAGRMEHVSHAAQLETERKDLSDQPVRVQGLRHPRPHSRRDQRRSRLPGRPRLRRVREAEAACAWAATSASPATSSPRSSSAASPTPASTCSTSACAAPKACTSPRSPGSSTAASW